MAIRVAGQTGSLRVGYQVGAQLGAWALELLPELPRRYRLSAAVTAVSDYWLAQTPLAVHLEVGREIWIWSPVTPVITHHRLTLILAGTPQRVPGPASVVPSSDPGPFAA
jgi:hypothetical protein